jgi:hypothetical protein
VSLATREGLKRRYPVKAATKLTANTAILLVAGLATPIAMVAGLSGGVSTFEVDNTAGADGAAFVEVIVGEHKFVNSGDITRAEVGTTAYFVNARSLSKVNTGGRPAAGKITQVDEDGVWVVLGV